MEVKGGIFFLSYTLIVAQQLTIQSLDPKPYTLFI